MGLREDIVALLLEPTVVRINFSLGGLSINGAGFGRVRTAILEGNIKLRVDSAQPDGSGAYYVHIGNRIFVDPSTFAFGIASRVDMRALMLHECSHALVDLCRAVATTILTDEAAAYIVQLIYLLDHGQTDLRRWASHNRGNPLANIFHKAIGIIDRFGLLRGSANLQFSQYNDLRLAVQRDPFYRRISSSDLTQADG
jgi:hypothetical protein